MKSATMYLIVAIFGYLALSANVPLKSEAHSTDHPTPNGDKEQKSVMVLKSRVVEQPRNLPSEIEASMKELRQNVNRLKQRMSSKGK